MRWAGHVPRTGDRRGVYRVLVGKLEGKRTLGRSRHRWEYNIKMHLVDVRWRDIDRIDTAQVEDGWRLL
jgi:hypothetical protein